ncbi:MAG: hypothetical protein NWE92_07990 [Candidatus Bathyarchaeota archaeon]|nr:hypothetical protein [Candidatus Bathyarchaeota archaeon]
MINMQSTALKLQHELNSLQGLSIINLMCSAMAFAFGAYFLMPNLVLAATTLTIPPLDQLGLMVLGGLAFAIGFRWMFSTIKILEFSFDMGNNLTEHKKEKTLDDETLTGLIVGLTAAYRENKPTIKLMMTISKVACALFALGASLQIISLIAGGVFDMSFWLGILNAGVCYGVAVACYIIPHFLRKYSEIWDQRLSQTAKAEVELQKVLGEV